ncbi:MAG TPA: TorF family putative porin [Steroidobacter sp.]|uniref:TorF family putative porin n=1 Tax=Steroidobacter sp. TaxID=1978227 RepID=UPI002EDB7ED7
MSKGQQLAAMSLLTLSAAANAGVSSTWTLVSDYDFRGITQSAQDPAVQASLDYAYDSGWYGIRTISAATRRRAIRPLTTSTPTSRRHCRRTFRRSDGTPDDVFSSEARAVLTVATTFPWRAD